MPVLICVLSLYLRSRATALKCCLCWQATSSTSSQTQATTTEQPQRCRPATSNHLSPPKEVHTLTHSCCSCEQSLHCTLIPVCINHVPYMPCILCSMQHACFQSKGQAMVQEVGAVAFITCSALIRQNLTPLFMECAWVRVLHHNQRRAGGLRMGRDNCIAS